MNQSTWHLTASHLALAVALTAGLAATPFAFNEGVVTPNTAAAQATGDDDDAGTGGQATGDDGDTGTAAQDDELGGANDDGAAEEFVQDPTSDVGGSGSPGVDTGEKRLDLATMNTDTPAFREYKAAAERNDLDAAARALSDTALAEEAITPEMVEQVNEELDVRTTLMPEQIVEAVKRDLPY